MKDNLDEIAQYVDSLKKEAWSKSYTVTEAERLRESEKRER